MTLAPGRTLSQYRLVQPIGEGGMGVVWRATDSTLGRDVAIKVLPDAFATDPERLARFEREARLLASLNDPHIASIYGLHQADGVRFLAMELVDGEDLSERIARGPIPVAEALPLALQIAEALEHAHEKGVIHRDLKPANVKLTADGQAKVLDFGLAKALEGDLVRAASSSMLSYSPTITQHMTEAHVLLGTAAYMAPEQARGQVADRRADIWAFGVVLMEMLTGRRLFQGETISDTLAEVLKTPPDWGALPSDTPARVRALIRRCLERNPKQRLRDIGEARIVLSEAIAAGPDPTPAATAAPVAAPAPARRGLVAFVAAAGIALGALAMFGVSQVAKGPATVAPLRKFHLMVPPEEGGDPKWAAISPDGCSVAYIYGGKLWVQSLSELAPRAVVTDPNLGVVFWSPDSRLIAYIAGTRLMRTTTDGSDIQAVCDIRGALNGGEGAAWGADGQIVYSRGDSAGILAVPALGGDPKTIVPPGKGESDLHEPSLLPGGRGILFCGHREGANGGINNITLYSGGRRTVLLELPGQRVGVPVYSPTGHILFQRTSTTPGVWALPFSLAQLKVTGEPFLVEADATHPSVALDGTLACSSGSATISADIAIVDRNGKELTVVGTPEEGDFGPAFSPDGTRIARSLNVHGSRDIYVYDIARGTRTRLTFEGSFNASPAWSPDGTHIAFHSQSRATGGNWTAVVRRADATGATDTLSHLSVVPNFTPDGAHVLFAALRDNGASWDLKDLPFPGGGSPRTLIQGNPWVLDGHVSPDGALLAYMSHESGDWQVYLTRYPSIEGRWQVSTAGGQWPRWNAKGDRLYYTQDEDVMEVSVADGANPALGTPQKLFARTPLGTFAFGLYESFDVNRDGTKFAVLRGGGGHHDATGVTILQSWSAPFLAKK